MIEVPLRGDGPLCPASLEPFAHPSHQLIAGMHLPRSAKRMKLYEVSSPTDTHPPQEITARFFRCQVCGLILITSPLPPLPDLQRRPPPPPPSEDTMPPYFPQGGGS